MNFLGTKLRLGYVKVLTLWHISEDTYGLLLKPRPGPWGGSLNNLDSEKPVLWKTYLKVPI